jgi:hypothetical protein
MSIPTHQNETILSNYELLKKDEDRYNQNSFEIRKLASTWLLTTSAGISYLISQYNPVKPISLSLNPPPPLHPIFNFLIIPSKIGSRELIALVALLGLLGLMTLAIIDLFLYLQLLKATVVVSKEMESSYPDTIIGVRTNVINQVKTGQNSHFPILRLASGLFYFIPIILLIAVMYLFSLPIFFVGTFCLLFLFITKQFFLPIKDLSK